MTIQALQYDIQWMDANANISVISNHLAALPIVPDLLVLPEMYLSGFNMDAPTASITEDSPEIQRLIALADTYDTGLIGSLAIADGSHFYNRVLLITSDGIKARYDKRYRFTPSGESKAYAYKYAAQVITYRDHTILPQVCYDLRFPEYVRSIETPDILLYMANWPSGRIHHWEALLRARAIENQCYVMGCNRTGVDHNGWTFPGHSMTVRYDGMVEIITDGESTIGLKTDLDALREYRNRYPFLLDKAPLTK